MILVLPICSWLPLDFVTIRSPSLSSAFALSTSVRFLIAGSITDSVPSTFCSVERNTIISLSLPRGSSPQTPPSFATSRLFNLFTIHPLGSSLRLCASSRDKSPPTASLIMICLRSCNSSINRSSAAIALSIFLVVSSRYLTIASCSGRGGSHTGTELRMDCVTL